MTAPVLHIDFETRGVLDLREVGLHRYARDPHTDVWCMSWALGDEEPLVYAEHWTPDKVMSATEIHLRHMLRYVEAGGIVVSHNAVFELEIWREIMAKRYGWPVLRPEQTYCTMAAAYAMGLPGALEDAALAMGLSVLKDTEGRALMLRMARPRRMDGNTLVWWDEPEKLARLYAYCQQDVRVERELHKRLMPLSHKERKVWLMDYAINQRGIQADIETAKAAIILTEKVKEKCNAELSEITQGAVTSATALPALKEWIAAQGVGVNGLAKQDVVDLLSAGTLPDNVSAALALRQEAGKASTAKLAPLVAIAGQDGRLHNILQYHGAATGRWAGRKIQPHNFPREVPPQETVHKILALIRAGEIEAIEMIYGPPMAVLSKCLRGFLIAKPGHVLIVGDFANVESRGVAWFSGEDWKVQAFRAADAGTGPGIYEDRASRILGIPVEQITALQRQTQGKVPELAFGYQGGVGAARKFLPPHMRDTKDAVLNAWKEQWRADHPKTRATWYALEKAATNAVLHPGDIYQAGHPSRPVKFKVAGSFLWCLLPSGRALCYPYPKLLEGQYGPQLTYMTVPSADKSSIIADPKNASNWARCATYGGAIMQNTMEGICRDLLVDCMLALHEAGAQIVLHVHDEIVIEVEKAKAEAARAEMQRLMRTPSEWAAGFPLWADCKVMTRYGK